ncbi:hypothetical protein [Streptomyces poonensis]|uniref:Uncharacterized protein n=1 Tax=Streptomyces poonensis TaxID=68255 RepID=A0A918QGN7_9ACTN|nr:hypothetical protein [Streptomyces poonensis]GGZ44404.1 hypothetical protein GCM10010365_76050 [Streptomyces poonensis]
MPDLSHDPLYLWLTGPAPTARREAVTPASMPARRPRAATAADIAEREGLDLGDLTAYQRRGRRPRRGRQPKATVLSTVISLATDHGLLPRETAITYGRRWAASQITEPQEAAEWIRLVGLDGLDQALKLRGQGITPAQEKARRAREEQDRLAARAVEDCQWAELATRYRPGVARQLRLDGCTPDMLDRVINGKTADQLLRAGRPVPVIINALRAADN